MIPVKAVLNQFEEMFSGKWAVFPVQHPAILAVHKTQVAICRWRCLSFTTSFYLPQSFHLDKFDNLSFQNLRCLSFLTSS